MFDFPNAPAIGDRVTGVGGIVYVWDGVKWTSNVGAVTVQSMGDVGRNLIHNSMFNVAQRGVGPFTVNGYTLDRWSIFASLDTVTISQSAMIDASRTAIGDETARFALQATFIGNVGAASQSVLIQPIEDVRRLGGKTVTLSFWASASAALKLGVNFGQAFGTGGSPSAQVYATAQSVTLSTTWTRYSLTFTLPSVIGKTLGTSGTDQTQLLIWYSSGTTNASIAGNPGVQSGTVYIWGVQLEIGSVVTPLEKPDPQVELANCQRFYQIVDCSTLAYNGAGGNVGYTLPFPVTMRAAPTIAISGVTLANATTFAASPTSRSLFIYWVVVATGTCQIGGSVAMSADL